MTKYILMYKKSSEYNRWLKYKNIFNEHCTGSFGDVHHKMILLQNNRLPHTVNYIYNLKKIK